MKESRRLKISVFVWLKLMYQLKKRGKESRESGAFLLAKNDSQRITSFICFDDLDPDCLTGGIEFSHRGYQKLWSFLKGKNLRVIADVHTHPSNWTGQSIYDKMNPTISNVGHVALIVPHFAKVVPQFLEGVGIYEYLGEHQWNILNHTSVKITLL